MPVWNIIQAVNDALRIEMRRDSRVVVLGEDVGKFGGVFRATTGLFDEFGPDRVFDTPLAEAGIIGSAIGMALYGLRPVPEIQFADFIYPAYDQIVNELAKFRYRSGGQYPCPVVIRTPYGGGIRGGHYHSQSPEAYFAHTPGLKVVIPSNPYDAKGLLLSAMRGEDPVIFMEPKRVYRAARGEVPEGDYTVPIGEAKVVRPGKQVSIVTWGAMLYECLEAANQAAAQGVDAEVIDLRTLWPLDIDTVIASVKKTNRAVIVEDDWQFGGFGGELSAQIMEKAFDWLDAPVARVSGKDVPMPYNRNLEFAALPSEEDVVDAVLGMMRG
jgi:pyruvate dehydrogenase E1 component beta subunit